MGPRTSRVKYDQLIEASGLSRRGIDRLHSDYLQAAGHDGVISMDEFIRFYSRLPWRKILQKKKQLESFKLLIKIVLLHSHLMNFLLLQL